MLVINADSDADSYEPPYNTVADVLEDFDSMEDNITIFDQSEEGDIFTGNKEEAIQMYGDLIFLSIEAPKVISIVTDNNIEPYSIEDSKLSPLEEDIYRLHKLSARKITNPKCDEYWIHESLENGEDLDVLYEHFIKGTILEQQFKNITGYRDAVDEAYDLTETAAKNDDESEAIENAKHVGKVAGCYSVVYGYKRNGKFYAIDPITCRDQKENLLASDYVNAKYHAGNVRVLYSGKFGEELDIHTSSATKMEIDDNSAIISSEDQKINVESSDGADVRVADDGSVEVALKKEEAPLGPIDEPEEEPMEEPADEEPIEPEEGHDEVKEAPKAESEEGKEVEPVPAVESVKNRAELTAVLKECIKNKTKYTIKRSLKEGYRYYVIKEANELVKPDEVEVVDPSSSRELARSEQEIAIMNKIRDVSKCIADNIKKYYNIEADPELIVADILQDLRLISGDIKPEQLENSPINNLTKSMYQSYTDFYEVVDELMSMFAGKEIHTTPAKKLSQAIMMLDSPMFSPVNIEKGIASDRFIEKAREGTLPFIQPEQLPMLENCDKKECDKEMVDMDIEKFDNQMNEYFDSKYPETVLYHTNEGYIDPRGNILLKGVVESEDGISNISYTLTPEKRMNEGVEETIYTVTNNLSEEKFEFTF